MKEMQKVAGKNKGKVMLYALSTCIWCQKTKKLLDSLGVEYSYLYMDDVEGEAKKAFHDELEKWNPRCSFPTLVINDKKCIIGFDEEAIRRELA